MKSLIYWSAIIASAFFLASSPGAGATFTVTSTNNSGVGTLSQAITGANGVVGTSTIVFDLPGSGPHTIELTSQLPFINANIEIINDNPGDETVTLRRSSVAGTPDFSIFNINSGHTVLIAGLTITNGRARSPGPFEGGGIRNVRSALTVRNCTLTANYAIYGGAIFNTTFTGSGSGDASVTLVNCILTGNSTIGGPQEGGEGGGAIYNTSNSGNATVALNNCILNDNSAYKLGGAIANVSSSNNASVSLNDCTLNGNGAASGGAVSNRYASGTSANLTLSNCTLTNNKATKTGGLLDGVGGAIYNEGPANLSVTNSTLAGNNALNGGGVGIISGGSTATLSNNTFALNGASFNGGGIYNSEGTVTVTNCTLSSNSVSSGNGSGGGIYNAGAVNKGNMNVINSTIFGNSAPTGGGIRNDGSRTSGNTNLTLANTVLKTGQSGSNIVNNLGSVSSLGHNLSNDSAGGDANTGPGGFLNSVGDIRNTDPQVGPLRSNGGPTQTHALSPASSAINGGDDVHAPALDQRGYPRVGASDIGAFEFQQIPSILANISTRLRVETGDGALIGGLIVTGTQPKKIIIRAIGPSLFFPDELADPVLELHDSSGALLETNDNWVDSPNKQAIIDSTIPPSNDLESAIVRSVVPGNYTAIVRGVNNGTGIGVVEAYDLDPSADSKLANISTRGFVQTGDNVLIAGTIVVGQTSQKVIVRGIGPSLSVPGKMADPTLELHDGNGALLEGNDNWQDSPNKQAIIDSTIPPSDPLEPAIVRTLAPGNYTAILRGVNNTTDIAVVEVYALN